MTHTWKSPLSSYLSTCRSGERVPLGASTVMQPYPGSSARVVRLSLRRVFVVLLARGSSLPVVLVVESERCCVESIPVLHLTTGSVRSVYLGLHG